MAQDAGRANPQCGFSRDKGLRCTGSSSHVEASLSLKLGLIGLVKVGRQLVLSLGASGDVSGVIVWQKSRCLGVRFALEPDEVSTRFAGVVSND